ncbi:flavin reductase family protein [Streptomyces sp. NPDC041068]|uniref:flavin reductase family protein n=1 Tax=Streptomyces sp. NPDC041068 TaxID=3155130 RepID=UPI0033C92DCD
MTDRTVDVEPEADKATPDGFRSMMSGFPSGVGVVTSTGHDGAPRGMTCSSVSSVSLDPPTLLVCLRHGSPTLEAILERGTFAVNLLHEGAQEVAKLFASGNPERFRMTPWEQATDAGGPHLVDDAHTIADCDVVMTHRTGDHVTVFGEARLITRRHAVAPLLYGLREFRAWSRI